MLTVVTPPTAEPVEVEDAKRHARVFGADEETLIAGLVQAARELCETITRRAIPVTGFRQSFDRFPACGVIVLDRPPLVAVSSVQYVDTDGVLQTLDPSQYVVDAASEPGRLLRAYDVTWPDVRQEGVAEPVQVSFTAGWADPPEAVRHAIRLLVAHWYEHREEVVTTGAPSRLPVAVKSLLATASWGDYP